MDLPRCIGRMPTGFPKARNISKAIDKKLGAERKKIGRNPNSRENCDKSNTLYESGTVGKTAYHTEPATEEAKKLDGAFAGFQPKPAVEVIIVAMKPCDEKTYADQALSNGKGVTYLDDCRIPYVMIAKIHWSLYIIWTCVVIIMVRVRRFIK